MKEKNSELEKLVAKFQEYDAKFTELESYVSSGDHVGKIQTKEEWVALWERLRTTLEDRNSNLRAVKDLARSCLAQPENVLRGPKGKASRLEEGPFSVNSVTSRDFKVDTLISVCEEKGILRDLQNIDVSTKGGGVTKAVRQEWVVDYDAVMGYLLSHKHDDVMRAAYTEKEKTPVVKGPKEVYFLGDAKKD